jgi:hypothetical protein
MAKASRRKNAISAQFSTRTIPMLECPAYRVLSLAAHRVLSRLEVEHAHHGGKDNGALICTYDQFVSYGLHRHAIGPALRELEALGFIETMRKGCALNGDLRQSSLYRLTHRHLPGESGDGTHEYLAIETIAEAEGIAESARKNSNFRISALAKARAKKQNASDGKRHSPVTEIDTESSNPQ